MVDGLLVQQELWEGRTPAVSRADSRSEARAAAVGVGFRVEPVVTQPAPPQTRTCAMHASGSAVTRGLVPRWRITGLPCKLDQMVWTSLGMGTGYPRRSFWHVSQPIPLVLLRRLSQ
jgi:hypothetical protein